MGNQTWSATPEHHTGIERHLLVVTTREGFLFPQASATRPLPHVFPQKKLARFKNTLYLCGGNKKKTIIMTKEEAMARFMAAKEKKRQCVAQLEEKMKQSYEQRTGKPAKYTFVL